MFKWIRKLFPKRPTYHEAFIGAKSPVDISRIVRRWISERAEVTDRWERPEITWNRGYGDCEDFALLTIAQCRKLNYSADLYLFYPLEHSSQGGHAMAVDDGWMADNGYFFAIDSFDDVKRRAARILHTKPEKIWWVKVPYDRYENLLKNPVDF